MIAAICRALRLSPDEAAYLHHLAGEVPSPLPGPVRDVRASVGYLQDLGDRVPT